MTMKLNLPSNLSMAVIPVSLIRCSTLYAEKMANYFVILTSRSDHIVSETGIPTCSGGLHESADVLQ